MDKKTIRKIYLKKREQLRNLEIDEKIINRFLALEEFKKASSIFTTISIGSEINTNKIIQKAFELNKKVYIPKINKEKNMIIPTEIKSSFNELVNGIYNIPEPKDFPKNLENPDLVIVPGLVFSKNGFRIGYGGGFYDRYLEKYNPKTTSLVYDELLLDKIPVDYFDYPVDQIITEKRIINLK